MTSLSSPSAIAAVSSSPLHEHEHEHEHDQEETTNEEFSTSTNNNNNNITTNNTNNNNNKPLNAWWKQKLLQVQTNDQEFVDTIDDALKSLSYYNNEEWFPTSSQQNEPLHQQHDWILDGHKEWQYQYDKTKSLLQELHKDPILQLQNETMTANNHNNATLAMAVTEEGTNNNQEELALWMLGSVGNQEFQFASFEDAFPTETTTTTTTITTTTEGNDTTQKKEKKENHGDDKPAAATTTTTTETENGRDNNNFACFEDAFQKEEEKKEQQQPDPTTTTIDDDDDDGDCRTTTKDVPTKATIEKAASFDDILPTSSSLDFGEFYTAPSTIVDDDKSPSSKEDKKEAHQTTTATATATTPKLEDNGDNDDNGESKMDDSNDESKMDNNKINNNNNTGNNDKTDLDKKCHEGGEDPKNVSKEELPITATDHEGNTKDPADDKLTLLDNCDKDEVDNDDENGIRQLSAPTTATDDNDENVESPKKGVLPASPKIEKSKGNDEISPDDERASRTKSLLDDDENQDEVVRESPDRPTIVVAQDDEENEEAESTAVIPPEEESCNHDYPPSPPNVTMSTPATLMIRSKQQSVAASSDGDASTPPSIPSTVEWKVPTPLNLSQLLSSPAALKSTMAMAAATVTTPTPSKMLMTPGSLSLTSELASPEGRFLRRRVSQPLFEEENNHHDNEYDDNLIRYAASNTNYTSDGDDDGDGDDDDVLSSPTAATTVLDVSDLNIPALFFEAKPDDSPYLATLEWEWWPWVLQDDALMGMNNNNNEEENGNDKVVLLHDEITQRLSQLDQLHRHVCQRLYKHVSPHAKTLAKTNRTALELVKNYRICQMYVKRSQESLQKARYGDYYLDTTSTTTTTIENEIKTTTTIDEDDDKKMTRKKSHEVATATTSTSTTAIVGGVQGANDLLQTWDTQESYTKLQSLLEWIQHVYEREDALKQRIRDYDVRLPTALDECLSIAQDIKALQEQLQEEPSLSRWTALTDMKIRVTEEHPEKLTQRLHEWMESVMIATNDAAWHRGGNVCGSGAGIEQKEEAEDPHNILDETRLRLLEALRHVGSPPAAVAATMQAALLMQAQKAWGLALLDPTISEDGDDDDEEYDKELLALSYAVQQSNCNQDVWISNLMTIRLEWEALQKFPAIYHKLCVVLCRVLYGAYSNYRLLKFQGGETKEGEGEQTEKDEFCQSIHVHLLARRASIWNACIQTLERSLEEYVKHMAAAKETQKKLGKTIGNDKDNDWWYREWEGLHDIWRLTQQFLSLRHEFGESDDTANDGTCLQERLETIFKSHLRSIHVEAMNNVGKLLHSEDWTTLVPLDTSAVATRSLSVQDGDKAEPASLGFEIHKSIELLLIDPRTNHHTPSLSRSLCNSFCIRPTGEYLAGYREFGNPFDAVPSRLPQDSPALSALIESPDPKLQSIYDLIVTWSGTSYSKNTGLVPNTLVDGILPWTSRLLLVVRKIPKLGDDACKILSNIFNLYTTTIFRVCAGSAQHERILLDIGKQDGASSKDPGPSKEHQSQLPSSPLFGFRRRSSSSLKATSKKYLRPSSLSAHAEAEICAPIPRELDGVANLRNLIVDGQQKLEGIAKLDLVDSWVVDPPRTPTTKTVIWACQAARVLEQRQVALWSSIFLATALQSVRRLSKERTEVDSISAETSSSPGSSLETYVDSYIQAVTILIPLLNRISCVRAIRGKEVVQEVMSVGSGWEESKLHEHPNHYVDSLCDLSALLWCSLSNAKKLSPGVLYFVWEHIVECGYLTLLDGFSRVPFCSTEGRALMSMDLLSFSSGIRPSSIAERLEGHSSSSLPPDVATKISRGMPHVDTFIKVFYFPPKDAMGWIEENYQTYLQDHAIALIVGAATSSDDRSIRLDELVGQVTKLYRQSN